MTDITQPENVIVSTERIIYNLSIIKITCCHNYEHLSIHLVNKIFHFESIFVVIMTCLYRTVSLEYPTFKTLSLSLVSPPMS